MHMHTYAYAMYIYIYKYACVYGTPKYIYIYIYVCMYTIRGFYKLPPTGFRLRVGRSWRSVAAGQNRPSEGSRVMAIKASAKC